MSNLTLKEQLQALAIGTQPIVDDQTPKNAKKKKNARPEAVKNKPAWLEQAQYGVELLKAYFPACFFDMKETKPLKVGIKQDLVKQLSTLENIVVGDKACMITSLAYYVNSVSYHRSVVVGAQRIGLNGEPAGVVTAEEAQYSEECRKNKLEKRKSNVKNVKKDKLEV